MKRKTKQQRPGDISRKLRIAARDGKAVTLVYDHPEDGQVERHLLPDAELPLRATEAGNRVVIGRDLERQGPRNFRLDRIVRVK